MEFGIVVILEQFLMMEFGITVLPYQWFVMELGIAVFPWLWIIIMEFVICCFFLAIYDT